MLSGLVGESPVLGQGKRHARYGSVSVVPPGGLPAGRPALIGRRMECETLDRLVGAVRAGESKVLVLHGEPGVGKSALLEHAAEHCAGCQVIRAGGVESEMELPYAALQQLFAPLLDRRDRLPAPQRDALGTAFGLTAGTAPDRLLVGLAALGMLAEAADQRPVVCLIDDLQWIDRASAQTLAFVARRLVAESVGLIFATRVPRPELGSLPQLQISGLREPEARALFDSVLSFPLDEQVRGRFLAETRGNPLAILELPQGLSPQDMAGGFGLPRAVRISAAVEERFRRGVETVPEATRRLLLLAAAEPLGDPGLLWAAAHRLGIDSGAATCAVEAGLADFGTRVRFRHPLVRTAVYRSAALADRQAVHCALAEATDPEQDPDRRAWHLAHAAVGPDDDVAAELERSSDRARARGGMAAAAAFQARATVLTQDRVLRTERALIAASAQVEAGAFDTALDLLAIADSAHLDDSQRARADLIRAQLAHVTGRGKEAPPLLLKAARTLAPIDPALSRVTYLQAMSAAMFAGRLAQDCGVREVAVAAQHSPAPITPRLPDLLLDGLSQNFAHGYAASVSTLRRAVRTAMSEHPHADQLPWLWLAGVSALHVWDDESWDVLTERHVTLARETGALTELPPALSARAVGLVLAGELDAVAALNHEAQAAQDATGDRLTPYGALTLAAFRGPPQEATALIESAIEDVTSRGEGVGLTAAWCASAILHNGIGDYRIAMRDAQRATATASPDIGVSTWSTVELVEAAVRCGEPDIATGALGMLTVMAESCGTDWALGVHARCRALVVDDDEAEALYREAIERLSRTRVRAEHARAHLVYGEWLRRDRQLIEARDQLRAAHDMFDKMGMAPFAERAGRELKAAGGAARRRRAGASGEQLTAQEIQIARLAGAGLTNPEIGARLYISSRTVQYHLRKVFTKLDISSRSQLAHLLDP